jgi:hypothetical protein
LNAKTGVAQHGDQRIDTEAINLASNEVADSRLGDAEQARGLCLREAAILNHLANPNHEIRPDLEILSFLLREPEVAKDVSA